MNVTCVLDPAELQLGPGESASVDVGIGNASDVIEHYSVSVLGLPEGETAQAEPEVCKLHPGETGRITLTIGTDAASPPAAGRHVLGVRVSSPYRHEVQRTEELVVRALPAPALSLTVRPEVVSGRVGIAELTVSNGGNTELDVELGGSEAEAAVRLRFEPPRVRLDPRQPASVRVAASARRPLSGAEVRRQITLTGRAADGTTATTSLVLVQRPLVPGGVMRLVGAAAGVAVLAAAVIFAAVLGVNRVTASDKGGQPSPGASGASDGKANPSESPSDSQTGGTSGAPTSGGPTSGAPTSGGPTSDGGAGQAKTVHLDDPPPGKIAEDQVIAADAFPGLTLTALPAGEDRCAGVRTAIWLRAATATHDGVAPGVLTTSDGVHKTDCNDLALRIGLSAPAKEVTIKFISLQTGTKTPDQLQGQSHYILRDEDGAGEQGTTVAFRATSELTLTDSTGQGLRRVVISPEPVLAHAAVVATAVTVVPAA